MINPAEEPASSGKTAARGAFWTATHGIVSQVISFLVFVVLARMMDPAAYGLVALSMAVILALTAASRLGLDSLLVQLESAGETEINTAFYLSLLSGLILAALLWLGSSTLARLVDTPELGPLIRA